MTTRLLLIALVACATGCASRAANQPESTFGLGKNGLFIESSLTRDQLRIRRVAIVPNRLPASLLDPEKWRQSNFKLLAHEFTSRGFEVVDYVTASQVFESSGLPVEDTSVSRDKYAELARGLGVDAIVVPYYGTFAYSQSLLVITTNTFAVTGTLQIFLAEQNDFFSRIDLSGSTSYTVGNGLLAGLSVMLGTLTASGDNAQTVRTLGQVALGAGTLFDLVYGAVQGARAPDAFWKEAFKSAISTGVKPFFDAIGPPAGGVSSGGFGAPVQRPSVRPAAPQPAPAAPQPAPWAPQPAPYAPQPAPYAPQPAPYSPQPAPSAPQPAPQTTPAACTTSADCPAGRICLGGVCQ